MPRSPSSSERPQSLSRRELLHLAGAGATAAWTAGWVTGCASNDEPNANPDRAARRNILVIYADDQRYDTATYMPTIQRLMGEEGTSFAQARQSSPLCSPSRATLLRGQMATGPNGHGLDTNQGGLGSMAPDSLAPWLAAAGYRCGLAGKYFTNAFGGAVAPGWDWWRALVGEGGTGQQARGYSVFDGSTTSEPGAHQIDYLTEEVVDFVMTASEPWFLWDCPTSPHAPLQPTPRHANELAEVDWPVVGEDVTGKPSWITSRPSIGPSTAAEVQDAARDMLREVLDLDDHIAAVWATLVESGRSDRTTLIYTSDNGTALLDHRLPVFAKNLPYDVSARVPLLCVGAGFPAGGVVDAPASAGIDVTATCLAIAGAEATVPQDGTSLLELAADPVVHASRVVLGSCSAETDPRLEIPPADWVVVDQGAGLRKLVRYRGAAPADTYEAYDLDADPQELISWAGDPARRVERDLLETILDDALQ